MPKTHTLGLPRIGENRELKKALESYWKGRSTRDELAEAGRSMQQLSLRYQQDLDILTVGDFSFYDRMLDTAILFDAVPSRFRGIAVSDRLDLQFAMARGYTSAETEVDPLEMRKWFDTNYHYIVPELSSETRFDLNAADLLGQVRQAREQNKPVKVALIGPATFLYLSKTAPGSELAPEQLQLRLLEALAGQYRELLRVLHREGVAWVQLEEPILALDSLSPDWQEAIFSVYRRLSGLQPRPDILLATYFASIDDNVSLVAHLPVEAVHLDLVAGTGHQDGVQELREVTPLLEALPQQLSLGVLDGRGVWKADLDAVITRLRPAGDREILLAPSCSLLHLPYTTAPEQQKLPPQLWAGLAFAREKLAELSLLAAALGGASDIIQPRLAAHRADVAVCRSYRREHADQRQAQTTRPGSASPANARPANDDAAVRSPYSVRARAQQERLGLPSLPTTTIGSFPQTAELRRTRRAYRRGELSQSRYTAYLRQEIAAIIAAQEEIGLDVLVHGEPERNDMVEYFAEHLEGFLETANGWVQSYGSRCVKPAIIWADIRRPAPITLPWIQYAQSCTAKPVKGMLTGPVTMVKWSFPRPDISVRDQVWQTATALRDEVLDLEAAGIGIIQIDEAAFKEAQPLKRMDWPGYAEWASAAFRHCSAGAADTTQIHTHMCYSDFSTLLDAVAAMDADVLTIETSRSEMALLAELAEVEGLHELGPGIYDIHSPLVPGSETLARRLRTALGHLPPERLWVNPDCGLKTRRWEEIRPALRRMTAAARLVRAEIQGTRELVRSAPLTRG